MLSIGLTGGLGAGKSLATSIFYDLGANILNADDIAKNLLRVDPKLIHHIKETFGDACYVDGELQSAVLAERAFIDNTSLEKLNALVHPALKAHLEKYVNAFKTIPGILIVEVAILLEAEFQDIFDKILLITADKDLRVARALAKNNLSKETINARMALQMPEEDKRSFADYIIVNNGDEIQLREACISFLNEIKNDK